MVMCPAHLYNNSYMGFLITNTNNVENNNRIDPDLLNAFKENPYTHSLSSVA